jgi:tetratricopeptide (TPR) repeat protein
VATAGCGSTGTRPAEDRGSERAEEVFAPAAESRRERRARERASAEAAIATEVAATADEAGAPMAPPVEVPERVMAEYQRGLAAMNAGNWFDAQVSFEQLLIENPSFPGPYVNLAILYRRDSRVAEAEAALEKALAIAPNHPAANSELGIIYRERGDFELAEAAYRRAIEGDPGYALAHYNLGVLLDLYLKREAEALAEYEAYLGLLGTTDETVERWVVDLRRRLGIPADTAQVALEN